MQVRVRVSEHTHTHTNAQAHVYVRDVILLLALAYQEFATGTEQDCTIFAIHMLKDVSNNAGLRKNVEAKVMVVTLEAVIVLVLVRVILLRRRNVLVLEDLARLVVVLLHLVLDLDPADTQAHIRPDERNGFVDPPDHSHDMVIVLAHDLCVILHLSVHGSQCSLFLRDQVLVTGKTDKSTASRIVVAASIVEVSQVELHCKSHGQLNLLDILNHLQLVITLAHGLLGLRYVHVEDSNDLINLRLRIQFLKNGLHGLDKQIDVVRLIRSCDRLRLMRLHILLPHATITRR